MSAYVALAVYLPVSTGVNTVRIVTLERSGKFCPTWEGVARAVDADGAATTLRFSVRDEAVSRTLLEALAESPPQPIEWHYARHWWIPLDCFGRSSYVVVGAERKHLTVQKPAGAR